MKNLRPSELHGFVQENPSVQLIDVRSMQEFNAGAIENFVNIPLDDLMQEPELVTLDRPVVVMCHSGSRSLIASRILEMAGHKAVYNLTGGYMAF